MYQTLTKLDYQPLSNRVLNALSLLFDAEELVDIITFSEHEDYLNLKLYPRQRLILKIYYKLDLTDAELIDVKNLLRANNKYALAYIPGLCQHHILGHCDKKVCRDIEPKSDYRILSDNEIRKRLKSHHAHYLLVIAGRRGSKSMLGAIINAYELYKLLRDPSPQKTHNLFVGSELGTANVATDERQALILFKNLVSLIEQSKWFKKLTLRKRETDITFNDNKVKAISLHSNSASVRGNTLIAVFIDEICHFNRTTGKSSDKAMINAISPSVLTFKDDAKIVMISSPLNKAGEAWEFFHEAEERRNPFVIAFQLAAWEMNDTIDRDNDPEISAKYIHDPDAAEMEYGAQWAEQVGQFIPPEAVENCIPKDANKRDARTLHLHGDKSYQYSLHVDLSKKGDNCGLSIVHYDKIVGKVILDRIERFNPEDSNWTNEHGEIDHEVVFEYIVNLTKIHGFRFNSITFDQFNSQWLIQKLRKQYGDIDGKWIYELTVTDKSNREMYGNLRSLLVQGAIELYRNQDLVSELIILSKTIKASGAFKIEAPPGFSDDLADALAASSWTCLMLALGVSSGIVTINNTKKEEIKETKHSKGCSNWYCVPGCPVQENLYKR